jgi:type III polyketide synthase
MSALSPIHPVVCRPALVAPPYTISQDETVAFIERSFPDYSELPRAIKMIRNTQVQERHLLRPIEETEIHTGHTHRSELYTQAARRMAKEVALQAIDNALLRPKDISMVIAVSCTGFLMPSLTAMLINDLGLNTSTRQLPVAQMGCCAGAAAVNWAVDHCRAQPKANVLIVSVELASLCFQPKDVSISSLISAALFGDAATATVVRAQGAREGFAVAATESFFMPNSEHYIAYDVKDTGFHFKLDKDVMNSIEHVVPVMERLAQHCHGMGAGKQDFYFFHTGGRRIMNELVRCLDIDERLIQHSRNSLAEYGNISSSVVFDVLRRFIEDANTEKNNGQTGMMAAFGPGFTAEISTGHWVQQ